MLIALALAAALTPAQTQKLTNDILAQLETGFVDRAAAKKAVPELRAKWKSLQGDEESIGKQLNADLAAALHDRHLAVRPVAMLPPGALDGGEGPPSPEALAFMRRRHFDVMKAEILPGNIGVLQLDGFAPAIDEVKRVYANAFEFVAHTDALILDLRQNHGGEGDSVAQVMGHLLDKPTELVDAYDADGKVVDKSFSKKVDGAQYTKPVYVLTSGRTFSAGEECAYDVQTTKRGKVVGETTGGGGNHNRFVRVGDTFALSLPYLSVRSPATGKGWEAVGVQPDVKTAAPAALDEAQKLILRDFLSAEKDPRRKAGLERRLGELGDAKPEAR